MDTREDGPAVIRVDGTEEWWYHGKLHREGAPTVIKTDGTQEWWSGDIRARRR